MKKYKENSIIKLVYKRRSGIDGYWRFHKFTNTFSSLSFDYPSINYIVSISSKFTLHYIYHDQVITSWIDKYGNVIIRIIDLTITQSKINF